MGFGGVATVTLLSLIAALLVMVTPRPAGALIGNVIPANEAEEPTDTFTTANALFAIATVDPLGGRICVVPASTENPGDGSLSCDAAEPWASPNFVSGIGTVIVPIKGPFLKVGEWKLLGDSSRGARDALSIPFTVSPCLDCDTTIANEILAQWKAAAGVSEEAMGNVCTGATLYGRVGTVKAAGTNIRKAREIAPERAFVAQVVVAGVLTFAVFPTFSPQEFMARGMEMIADLSCAVTQMYVDIVADPPDPNFLEIAVPMPYAMPISGDPSIDQLSDAFSDVAAYGEAMLTSFERYLGALEAGNIEAAGMQAQAMADFGESTTVAMRNTADHLRSFGAAADADPDENDPVVTQAVLNDVVAIYERVRRDGFTAAELQQLQDAGLTQEEIDLVRAAFNLDISGAPVDRSFNDIVQESANNLDAAADEFMEVSLAAGSVAATIEATSGSNRSPNAVDDTVQTPTGINVTISVLANDSDPDSDSLTVTDATDPPNGTATVGPDNRVTYDPDGCFVGTDTFSYTISDGRGGTAIGIVTVRVRNTSRRFC